MAIELFATFKRFVSAMSMKPSSGVDMISMDDIPEDQEVHVKISIPRNIKFHRKYFALLNTIFDMMSDEDRLGYNIANHDQLLIRLKLDLGLYDLWVSHEGDPIYIPGSISFAKMDNAKFERFYKDTINIAIGKYVTTHTEASMMQMVDAILRFE